MAGPEQPQRNASDNPQTQAGDVGRAASDNTGSMSVRRGKPMPGTERPSTQSEMTKAADSGNDMHPGTKRGGGDEAQKSPISESNGKPRSDSVGAAKGSDSPKAQRTSNDGYTVRGNPEKMLMENKKAKQNWNDAVDRVLEKEFKMGSADKNRTAFGKKIDSLHDGPQKIGGRLNLETKSGFARSVFDSVRKAFYRLEADPAKSSSVYSKEQRARLANGAAPDPRQQLEHLNDLSRNPKGSLNPNDIYLTEGGKRGTLPKDSPHGQKTSVEGGSPGQRLRDFQEKHGTKVGGQPAAGGKDNTGAHTDGATGGAPGDRSTGKVVDKTATEADKAPLDAVAKEPPARPSPLAPDVPVIGGTASTAEPVKPILGRAVAAAGDAVVGLANKLGPLGVVGDLNLIHQMAKQLEFITGDYDKDNKLPVGSKYEDFFGNVWTKSGPGKWIPPSDKGA